MGDTLNICSGIFRFRNKGLDEYLVKVKWLSIFNPESMETTRIYVSKIMSTTYCLLEYLQYCVCIHQTLSHESVYKYTHTHTQPYPSFYLCFLRKIETSDLGRVAMTLLPIK